MSKLWLPSYAQGYARNASESESPGLWKGLQGLWTPSLGPTGLTLRDQSGFGNHGTLTNMDPATDWVATEKGWALDYDGSAHYVNCGHMAVFDGAATLTLAALIRPDGVQENERGRIISNATTSSPFALEWNDNGYMQFRINGNFVSGNDLTVAANEWSYVSGTYDGTTLRTYANNQLSANTTAVSGVLDTTANNTTIGDRPSFARAFGGRIAWVGAWARVLSFSENQQLYVDPHALLQPRRRVFAAAAAPPAGGHPTMRRWGGVPHMMPGPVLAGRGW